MRHASIIFECDANSLTKRASVWSFLHNEQQARGQAVRWSFQKHWPGAAAVIVAVVSVAVANAAEPDVRIADPSLKGCAVKGVVQAKVTAPQFPTFGFLTGDAPPLFGILKTDAI